jgi:hypothetical protein
MRFHIFPLCEHLLVSSPDNNGSSTPVASGELTSDGTTATGEFSQVGTFSEQD